MQITYILTWEHQLTICHLAIKAESVSPWHSHLGPQIGNNMFVIGAWIGASSTSFNTYAHLWNLSHTIIV